MRSTFCPLISLAVLSLGAFANPPLYLKSNRLGAPTQATAATCGRTPGRKHFLVQFDSPATRADLAALRARGARILGPVPINGYSISAPLDFSTAGLAASPAMELAPADKVSAEFLRRPGAQAIVVFHPDVDLDDARAVLSAAGVKIRNNPDLLAGNFLVAASREQLGRIAENDEVAYAYPAAESLVNGLPTAGCGGALTSDGPVAQYVARMCDGWDGPGQGSAQLSYSYSVLTAQLAPELVRKTFEKALAEWSRHAQIDFKSSTDPLGSTTLAVLFARGAHGDPYPFDGPGGVLAHTFYPAPLNPEPIAGDLHFDDDETWGIDTDMDFYSVALHELGHALGLGHSDVPGAVMYPYYHISTVLTDDDLDGLLALYAPRTTPDPSDPATPTTPDTPTTPTTPDTPTTPTTPSTPDSPTTPSAPTPSTPAPTPPDTTAPSLSITFPMSTNYGTSDAVVSLRGTAMDNVGVTSVSWSADDGQSGTAVGTTFWSVLAVKLRVGSTTITVRASDAAGNAAWRSITVTRR